MCDSYEIEFAFASPMATQGTSHRTPMAQKQTERDCGSVVRTSWEGFK